MTLESRQHFPQATWHSKLAANVSSIQERMAYCSTMYLWPARSALEHQRGRSLLHQQRCEGWTLCCQDPPQALGAALPLRTLQRSPLQAHHICIISESDAVHRHSLCSPSPTRMYLQKLTGAKRLMPPSQPFPKTHSPVDCTCTAGLSLKTVCDAHGFMRTDNYAEAPKAILNG